MSTERVRSYSKEFKAQIVKECMETNNHTVVAKKHDVPPTTVYTWFRKDKKSRKPKMANHNVRWRRSWPMQGLR